MRNFVSFDLVVYIEAGACMEKQLISPINSLYPFID